MRVVGSNPREAVRQHASSRKFLDALVFPFCVSGVPAVVVVGSGLKLSHGTYTDSNLYEYLAQKASTRECMTGNSSGNGST